MAKTEPVSDKPWPVSADEAAALTAPAKSDAAADIGWPPNRLSLGIVAIMACGVGMTMLFGFADYSPAPVGLLLYDLNLGLLTSDFIWVYLASLCILVPWQIHCECQVRRALTAIKKHTFLSQNGPLFRAYRTKVARHGQVLEQLLAWTLAWVLGCGFFALLVRALHSVGSAETREMLAPHITGSWAWGGVCVAVMSVIGLVMMAQDSYD